MPRRRRLKSVAHGLLGAFSGRYNDIGGYWALGLLYKSAVEMNAPSVSIGIKGLGCEPATLMTWNLSSKYGAYLRRLCSSEKLPPEWIAKGSIWIEFNTSALDHPFFWTGSGGEPFLVVVDIEDDRGKHHTARGVDNCWQHDPNKERRSGRYEEMEDLGH